MTVKGGTGPACAACKYQRRRCTPDCPLAPYFPHDQPRLFRNTHRLFGVSNILKTLSRIDPACKPDAMRSLLFEADAWDRFPAQGCVAVILTLHFHIRQAQLELEEVNARLAAYRGLGDVPTMTFMPSFPAGDMPPNNCLPLVENVGNVDQNGVSDDVAALWVQRQYNDAGIPQDQFGDAGSCLIEQEYDEISPYFDTIDEERPYESSTDSSEKNTMQSPTVDGQDVVANELKDAAACFTLTSIVN